MNQFISVHDAGNPNQLAFEALALKEDPFAYDDLGKHKCLGLIFLNPSLRTRMSTQRAAQNLGMDVMILNINQESWALETKDGVKMDGNKVEHIRDAAGVMGKYCDILGIRSFARLQSKEEDEKEEILNGLIRFSGVPVISLESAFLHPLQSLADLMTIQQQEKSGNPRISLIWAPHVKALPQAVANSFAEWINYAGLDLTIACPEGYELDERYSGSARIVHTKEEALEGADFVYVKNWSKTEPYGEIETGLDHWMINEADLNKNKNTCFMHCLPVRRDVELSSVVLNSGQSLVIDQAQNRIYAAQAVLKRMLEEMNK